jgi:hypothetical protein
MFYIIMDNVMSTDKPKRKNTPRSLIAAVIGLLLIFVGLIAFPYAENRLILWLENDPFTPMCDAEHLELAYESDEAGDGWGGRLYRIRGDSSDQVALTRETRDGIRYDPYWSPDEQWLLLEADNQGWIEYKVMNRATGEFTYLNMVWPELWSPYWSPDGRYLVDWGDGAGPYSWRLLYPSQPDTSAYHAVSRHEPRWSPDGSRIIHNETGYENPEIVETVLIDVNNNFERQVLYEGMSKLLGWSPDGTFFAFVAEDELRLAEFDLTSHQLIDVKPISLDMDVDWISWSPDKQTLALVRANDSYLTTFVDRDSGESIWEISGFFTDGWLDSNVIRLKNNSDANNPSWAYGYIETQSLVPISLSIENDGLSLASYSTSLPLDLDYLIYATYSEESQTARLYIADGNGQHRRLLTTLTLEYSYQSIYQITPDGQYISYEGANSWLYLSDLETHRICRVVKGNVVNLTNYDWRLIPENER